MFVEPLNASPIQQLPERLGQRVRRFGKQTGTFGQHFDTSQLALVVRLVGDPCEKIGNIHVDLRGKLF